MKRDKLVPGLILVMIGGIFLLNNFGYIHFHWMNILHLWPVFLIIGGVNLVFAHNRSPLATIIKISVIIVAFGLLVFGNFDRFSFPYAYTYHSDDDNDTNSDDVDTTGTNLVKVEGNSNFSAPYVADAHIAKLTISGGGTTYNLSDNTDQLFAANTKEHFGKYEFTHSKQDSVYVLDFKMIERKGTHFNWGNHDDSNSVDFKLNSNPLWDIDVETGATKLDFDLSKFKIRNLNLSGGAASFNIKLGQAIAGDTHVDISTGVSSVNIKVPGNAACDIEADSGLSSTSFDGFTKQDDGHYQTPGFAAAKNKIYISISGGISDFHVDKY